MWRLFLRLFPIQLRIGQVRAPAVPNGIRLYVIGDVHGRADLLADLLRRIEQDNAARAPAKVRTILIGDIIDRGADSAKLVRDLSARMPAGLICLRGNHEATMIDAWDGDHAALRLWLAHGGSETLEGFGATVAELEGDEDEQLAALRARVPASVIDWMRALPLTYACGDYFFVHAGIRPGVALSRQATDDLLWIRSDFLNSTRSHGKVIVHGHTPTEDVEILPNRIGIDTGAYMSGRLSAIGLEATECWILQTPGAVETAADR